MWFSDMLGLLSTPGGQHGPQTSPQATPDSSERVFNAFRMNFHSILASIFDDFLFTGSSFVVTHTPYRVPSEFALRAIVFQDFCMWVFVCICFDELKWYTSLHV